MQVQERATSCTKQARLEDYCQYKRRQTPRQYGRVELQMKTICPIMHHMSRNTESPVLSVGNQILHVCEPPSASSYPTLVTALHCTGCDCIPHSVGIRGRTEGNRIPHCIPCRLHNMPESNRTRENNS